MIEYIHIVESQPLKRLIDACHQILPAAPVAIRARPHIVPGLRCDHELIPVRHEILVQQMSCIDLRTAILRAVVIRQIELRDTEVEGRPHHLSHILIIPVRSEIVPEAQRHSREHKPALPHTVVLHPLIA